MKNRKEQGRAGETAAASFLKKQGQEENTLLIVEVKTRTSSRQGYPCEAVDVRKQRKICRVYDHFRMERRLDDCQPVRFDVVEVVETAGGYYCRWIKNAFEYQGM